MDQTTNSGRPVQLDDLKSMMRDHFLKYASYVILDRAIPHIDDGLKPVQRRILYTLWMMDDGKLHKVANVAGQTMAYHPHGDAAIIDALVNLANKNYLLDRQGNFGNPLTGDSAAAARYIETRLSPLARETMFNPQITQTLPTYDGRRDEPIILPAKIPSLLMHGADGIAVGMSTTILPHNFNELLEAEIAILEGKEVNVLPDFSTGGIMDASEYAGGKGKVKVRAKIEVKDQKTLVIKEICYGTTTESLIRSIEEAAKRGKIKIEGIHDYTTSHVEIAITLPRGQYAEELIKGLYAFTECEVTLHPQMIIIKDELPCEPTVAEVLHYHVDKLQGYLRRELELERDRLKEKIFEKSLERIFIENRLYKPLEELETYEKIHDSISKGLEPFHDKLYRIPAEADRERLLSIPIRRITRFDLNKNREEIAAMEEELEGVEKELKNIKRHTIRYLQGLIKKYGKEYPRRTEIRELEQLDKRAIATKNIKVGVDLEGGYVGTKLSGHPSFECTNFDKILLCFSDGSYQVTTIPEKEYVQREGRKLVFAGVADKKSIITVVYKDPKHLYCYAKKFVVSQFILDKVYRFVDEGMELELLTLDKDPKITLHFVPSNTLRVKKQDYVLDDKVLVKGVQAKGMRLSPKAVKKITVND